MKFKIRKREQITFLLIVFMTFALMPNIISIFGYSLKVMYLIFVLLLFQILRNKEVYKPNMVLFIFWGYICLLSLMTTFKWGIDRLLINYCFGFIIITIFTSIGKNFQEQDWMDILKIVWGLLFTGILLNNIFQAYRFVEYFSYGLDHPFIKTVVTGGVNLEATWISILVLAFFYSKKRWIPLGISVFISFLYASRVAMISNIIVLFVFIYGEISADTRKKFFNRRIVVTLLSIVAIGILIAGSAGGGMLFQVISRFKDKAIRL